MRLMLPCRRKITNPKLQITRPGDEKSRARRCREDGTGAGLPFVLWHSVAILALMKRKLARVLVLLLLLAGTALVGLRTWVTRWVNRPALIAEMEAGWNCRAEI